MGKRPGTNAKRHAVTYGVAAIVAASAAGCGGDDDAETQREAIKSVPTTGHAPRERGTGATRRGTRGAEPGRPSAGRSGESRTGRASKRRPKNGRDAAVAAVARLVFERYGFRAPQVTVTGSGTAARAAITRGEACKAWPRTGARLTTLLLQAVPWLRSARVVVGPAGPLLSAYVQEHCRPVELPRTAGTVLLQRGTGLATTASFTVRSSRWSADFMNGGKLLQVSVMRGGVPHGTPVRMVGRGTGRHTFAGNGRASLRIIGTGEWVVRVRDGA